VQHSILWSAWGLKINSISCVVWAGSESKITVDSVYPLYGPVSGGTRVTISGQLLTVSIVTAVYIGEFRLYPQNGRLLWWPIINIIYKKNMQEIYFKWS